MENVIKISAGSEHSAVINNRNEVYTWGKNTNGQLGNGTTNNSTTPVRVRNQWMDGSDQLAIEISAGGEHTVVVTKSGTVYAWGLDAEGQVGLGALVSGADKQTSYLVPDVYKRQILVIIKHQYQQCLL